MRSRSTTPKRPLLHVKVYGAFITYIDEDCRSVTAVNNTGEFDILPKHRNFISVLSPCDMSIVLADGEQKKLTIQGGVMHVHEEVVKVYLDVGAHSFA